MTQDNPNGKKPPPPPPASLHFERSQVKCERCKRKFEHFIIEEIDNLAQLRCGDVLISRTEMVCLHCGWTFHWDVKRKALEEMAIIYGAIVKRLYSAE